MFVQQDAQLVLVQLIAQLVRLVWLLLRVLIHLYIVIVRLANLELLLPL